MLTIDEALRLVMQHAEPRPPRQVPTAEALGCILAEDVSSDVDVPPHDQAVVDGYAVVSDDLDTVPVDLEILEEITAGNLPTRAIERGTTSRIMTGAPLPAGADAVVMVEDTEPSFAQAAQSGTVRIRESRVRRGGNIMRRAASIARGQVVLHAGARVRPIEAGLLCEVGRQQVSVIGRPSVAVLPTGNELVEVHELPGPGQIRNTNGPMLLAAARRAGATTVDLGIGRDNEESLRQRIAAGLRHDVLIISGGVSAGVLDLVPRVLAELGVEQIFHKVRLKPGKPLWFGRRRTAEHDTLVFGLPGNPVSSFVCFELFARPTIGRLAGRHDAGLVAMPARLATRHVQRGERPTYHPARLTQRPEGTIVETLAWQGSGDLRTLADANALALFPAGDRTFEPGETIETFLLD